MRKLIAGLFVLVTLGACDGTSSATTVEQGIESTTSVATSTTEPIESPMEVTTTTSTLLPADPSQSEAEAARDAILPAVAARAQHLRVNQYPDDFGTTSLETSEGIWMISVPYADQEDAYPCEVGDTSGVYGLDWICLTEYAEILLLNSDTDEILKAYPFPYLEPRSLAVHDDAIYCIRQGDGAAPDSMLCRIDKATQELTVRVFPSVLDSAFGSDSDGGIHIPDTWTVDQPTDLVLWEELTIGDETLIITGYSGTAKVDLLTLELIDNPES